MRGAVWLSVVAKINTQPGKMFAVPVEGAFLDTQMLLDFPGRHFGMGFEELIHQQQTLQFCGVDDLFAHGVPHDGKWTKYKNRDRPIVLGRSDLYVSGKSLYGSVSAWD